MAVIKHTRRDPLLGHWFHTFGSCETCGGAIVEKQGQILSQLSNGAYIVQWFEWMVGEPTHQEIVVADQMIGWHFYDTGEEMKNTYTYELGLRHRACWERTKQCQQ